MKTSTKRAALVAYRLRLQGKTQDDLASELGVSSRMVRYVIKGDRSPERLRWDMARLLGLSYKKLWGEAEPSAPNDQLSAASNQ